MKSLKNFAFTLLLTCLIASFVSAQDEAGLEDEHFESLWGELVERQANSLPGFANHVSRLCELSDQDRAKLDAELDKALAEWKADFNELGKKMLALEKKYGGDSSAGEDIPDDATMIKVEEEITELHKQSEAMMNFAACPKAAAAIKASLSKEKFKTYKADAEQRKQREIDNTANLIVRWVDTKIGLSKDQTEYFVSKLKSELGERLIKDEYAIFDLGFSNSARFTPRLHEDDLNFEGIVGENAIDGGVVVVMGAEGNVIAGGAPSEKKVSGKSLFDQLKDKLEPAKQMVFEAECKSVFRQLDSKNE